jgi:hypothetical protein
MVGDGEVQIPLEKRQNVVWIILIGAVVLVGLILLLRSRL